MTQEEKLELVNAIRSLRNQRINHFSKTKRKEVNNAIEVYSNTLKLDYGENILKLVNK